MYITWTYYYVMAQYTMLLYLYHWDWEIHDELLGHIVMLCLTWTYL